MSQPNTGSATGLFGFQEKNTFKMCIYLYTAGKRILAEHLLKLELISSPNRADMMIVSITLLPEIVSEDLPVLNAGTLSPLSYTKDTH